MLWKFPKLSADKHVFSADIFQLYLQKCTKGRVNKEFLCSYQYRAALIKFGADDQLPLIFTKAHGKL